MDCHETAKYFGETIGFWIQTGAFVLSAIAAITIMYHNEKMAKRRATIDHIIFQKSNKELLTAIHSVYQLHENKTQLSSFIGKSETDEFKAILSVLNNHEFVALGIRRKAFEEAIYKELQYSNFLKVHQSSAGFIAELRKNSGTQTLFQEFEWLIKRWEKCPLKKHD